MGFFDFLFRGKKKDGHSESITYIQPKPQPRPQMPSINNDIVEIAGMVNMAHNTGNHRKATDLCAMLHSEVGPRKQGGRALINLPANDCQCVGLAFTTMAICYDFGDDDINSVAAENAYYCLAKSLIENNNSFCAPAIFSILAKRPQLLKDKLISSWCSIAQKEIGMPIGMALGGNPYVDPRLEDFRQQAISFKDFIMYFALTKFYDITNDEYLVPTDMPYFIPKGNEVRSFIETIKQNPAYGKSAFFGECEKHVKSVLAECEDTLSKY